MLKLSRVCALPSCRSHGGGQHAPTVVCGNGSCRQLVGRDHSLLLNECAGSSKQELLWRSESEHDPSSWYAFPPVEELQLEGITLPGDQDGKTLSGLRLSVCESHVAFMHEAFYL